MISPPRTLRRAAPLGAFLLACHLLPAPAQAKCYPVPVYDRWANTRLATALRQDAGLIDQHQNLNDAIALLRALVGDTAAFQNLENPLDHTLTETGDPQLHALLNPAAAGAPPAPLAALGAINPAFAELLAPHVDQLSAAAGALPSAITTDPQLAPYLLGHGPQGRFDALSLDALQSNPFSLAHTRIATNLANALATGRLESVLTDWRAGPPGALNALPIPSDLSDLLTLFDFTAFSSVEFSNEDHPLDTLLALIAALLSDTADPQQLLSLLPGLANAVPGPLPERIARYDELLPIGTVARTAYRCRQRPRLCSPEHLQTITRHTAPGRAHAHAIHAETEHIASTEQATVTWLLDTPAALTEAFDSTVRAIHHEAATQCNPTPETPAPARTATVPATTHSRPTVSDTLYTAADDLRTEHVPFDQNKILGSRAEHLLEHTVVLYGHATLATHHLDRSLDPSTELKERLQHCETLACEARVLLDAKTLEAELALRHSELRLVHLRYTLAQITNTTPAQRLGFAP